VGGHRGVRGEEGRVAEDGLPAAGNGAEAEEEEGRHAGEHLGAGSARHGGRRPEVAGAELTVSRARSARLARQQRASSVDLLVADSGDDKVADRPPLEPGGWWCGVVRGGAARSRRSSSSQEKVPLDDLCDAGIGLAVAAAGPQDPDHEASVALLVTVAPTDEIQQGVGVGSTASVQGTSGGRSRGGAPRCGLPASPYHRGLHQRRLRRATTRARLCSN
jgi:hypothetical protein